MAADALDVRIAHLEGAYEQIERRLGAVEGRIAAFDGKVDDWFAHVRIEIQAFAASSWRAWIASFSGSWAC